MTHDSWNTEWTKNYQCQSRNCLPVSSGRRRLSHFPHKSHRPDLTANLSTSVRSRDDWWRECEEWRQSRWPDTVLLIEGSEIYSHICLNFYRGWLKGGCLVAKENTVPGLRVIWGQCCPRVAAAPSLPNGPITQLSPYLTRNPGIPVFCWATATFLALYVKILGVLHKPQFCDTNSGFSMKWIWPDDDDQWDTCEEWQRLRSFTVFGSGTSKDDRELNTFRLQIGIPSAIVLIWADTR